MTQLANDFTQMPYPVRALGEARIAVYRVYKDPESFENVQAETAAEAIKQSGVEEPYRVIRDVPATKVLMDINKLAAASQAEAPVENAIPDSAPSDVAQEAAAADAEKTDGPVIEAGLVELSEEEEAAQAAPTE